jgi:hypothetical protein
MTKSEALQEARRLTVETGRKFVVRVDGSTHFVCPLHRTGPKRYLHDPGMAALGLLVSESLG